MGSGCSSTGNCCDQDKKLNTRDEGPKGDGITITEDESHKRTSERLIYTINVLFIKVMKI